MSVLHVVKVSGKSKEELIKGLKAAIVELTGHTSVQTTHKVEIASPDDEDEMEEVESPFAKNIVSNAVAPTVVDNEVDAEGIPWDSRIHASTKTKVSNGAWKKKKGVSDEEFFSVKQELRNRVAGTTVNSVATPVVAPVVPEVAAPVVAPTIPTIPQVQSGHTVESFKANFAMTLSSLITQGKITQEYVNSLKAFFNVSEIWMASPEQQEVCFHEFVKHGLVQRVG